MMAFRKKSSLALLAMIAAFVGVGATVAPTFAWANCTLTLSPSSQATTVGVGQTVTLNYTLYYFDSSPQYTSTFDVSASVTPGSPSGTWIILSVTPPNPVPSTPANPVSQTITVKVQAPSSPVGSTTSLTIKAVNNYDSGSHCSATTTLTSVAFPPPGVPQFPLGIFAAVGLALPGLLFFRRKYSARF